MGQATGMPGAGVVRVGVALQLVQSSVRSTVHETPSGPVVAVGLMVPYGCAAG